MIINWNGYPDDGAIGYGLGTILTWTSSIPPSGAGWTTPTAVHSKCGEDAPNNTAAKAIDNDTGTYWIHSDICYHWIIFDLEQTNTITKIRLYQCSIASVRWGTSSGLDVYISDNPADWGSAVWTGVLNAEGWQESGAFSKNGRYVKLVSKNDNFGQRMYEFDAYCGDGAENVIPVFMHDYRSLRET
jgi:hypothetical protein